MFQWLAGNQRDQRHLSGDFWNIEILDKVPKKSWPTESYGKQWFQTAWYFKHDRNPWIKHTYTKKTHSSPRFPTFQQNLLLDLFKIPGKIKNMYSWVSFRTKHTRETLKRDLYPYTLCKHPIVLTKTEFPLGFPRAPCSCGLLVFRWARRYMSYRPARPTDMPTD